MNEERKQYLDLAKIIAMFLVAWGHLVGTSTYALEIPGVINGTLEEPLCPASSHGLWKLENFFYDKFGIQFAVVGVIIFFVISGYFIPDMQIKYGNDNTKISGLFLHCMKRIFPMLWICVIVDGVFLFYVCGIRHSLHEYLATMTGVPFLFKQNSTIGVLWFLTTLIIMYVLATVIRRYSLAMIPCVYIALLLLTVLPLVLKNSSLLWLFTSIAYYSRMMAIILIGITWRLAEENWKISSRIVGGVAATTITLVILNVYQDEYGLYETYTKVNSFIAAYLVIMISKLLSYTFKKYDFRNNKEIGSKILGVIRELFMPFYLTHVSIGIGLIYATRILEIKPEISLAIGFALAIVSSFVINSIRTSFKRLFALLFRCFVEERGRC